MLAKYNKVQDMKKLIIAIRQAGADSYTAGAHILASIVMLVVLFTLPACDHSELWDSLPEKITEFINQYFPNSELQSAGESSDIYHVRIADGPGMTFDSEGEWLAVDGYGMPLPQVLLFDQLPPAVYDYLQASEQLNSVFSISRDKGNYTVTLLNNNIYYDTDTGKLSGVE